MKTGRIVLDRYRLTERLAAGGTAEVWRARDLQLDRDVAVKLLHPHLLPDAVSRARLAAEGRAAAALNHPSIVAVYDVDAHGAVPALVMEYVSGSSLAVRIAAYGPLPAENVARIGADIADALYLAHRRGVVHRDVKPGNILVGPDGRARLVDFGIAHSLAVGAERLTTTGMVIGTLHSMAPEQLLGGSITPRTDLYGLGAVLFEALTGRPPYAGSTPLAIIESQKGGPPDLPGVSAPLARVVAGCLQPDPSQRPIHAGAVASALRGWLAGDEGSAALGIAPRAADVDTGAETQARPAVPILDAPPSTQAPVRQAPAVDRRSIVPMSMVALVLAALLAVVILSSALVRPDAAGDPGPSPTPTLTAAPTPSPTPSFDIGALPRPIADEVQKWWEACGTEGEPPPFDLTGMSKKDVEEALKPLREECQREEEG